MRTHLSIAALAVLVLLAGEANSQEKSRKPEVRLDQPPDDDVLIVQRALKPGEFSGRGTGREVRITTKCGSDSSVNAVMTALTWLAEHQMPDGGWSFDHAQCPKCQGKCGHPGELADARNAATGLALLALLGAGETPDFGRFQTQVKAGLNYLVKHMKTTPQGGSLYESGGTMYSHGICTLALCEAYAMTSDEKLKEPAQKAVDFICFAQDPAGGGWRYMPRQKGDTSVTGWQVAALYSAHRAGLQVPPTAATKAAAFLDSVQSDGGAQYGYTTPGERPATTAVGLLCRLRLGWDRDNAALARGVRWLAEQGPSAKGLYHMYYSQQLMLQWGDDDVWKQWNEAVQPILVDSQATEAHEAGSWYFADGDLGARRGGRLYSTAMAVMTLEVYYRHLPIYEKTKPENRLPME